MDITKLSVTELKALHYDNHKEYLKFEQNLILIDKQIQIAIESEKNKAIEEENNG